MTLGILGEEEREEEREEGEERKRRRERRKKEEIGGEGGGEGGEDSCNRMAAVLYVGSQRYKVNFPYKHP